MIAQAMKFNKVGDRYVCDDYSIGKGRNGWWFIELSGKRVGCNKTLAACKAECAEHAAKWEAARAEQERAAQAEQERQHRMRTATEYSPSLGCSWAEWAELRVGFTLAQLREDEQQLKASRRLERAKLAFEEWSGYFESDASQEQLRDVIDTLMRELRDIEEWLRDQADEYSMRVITLDQVAAAEFNVKALKAVQAAFPGAEYSEDQQEALELVSEALRD